MSDAGEMLRREATQAFRVILNDAFPDVPELVNIEAWTSAVLHYPRFTAHLRNRPTYSWEIRDLRIGAGIPASEMRHLAENEFPRLWQHCLDDHLVRVEVHPYRQRFEEAVRIMAPPDQIHRYRVLVDEATRAARERRGRPHIFNGEIGRYESCRFIEHVVIPALPPARAADMARLFQETADALFNEVIMGGSGGGDVGSVLTADYLLAMPHAGRHCAPSPMLKARELLLSWLTPEQGASFERVGCFEVVGGETGTRYRINTGSSMNVDVLDRNGATTHRMCFMPGANVPVGDVMLAQKLALECNESAALKIANRMSPAGGGGNYGTVTSYGGGGGGGTAGQLWAIPSEAGHMYSNELSEVLRLQVQPLVRSQPALSPATS